MNRTISINGSQLFDFVKKGFEKLNNQQGSPWNALFGDYGLISNPSKAWDTFKNGRTNEVNENIARENLQFQRDNLEYEKALQQQIFQREDTAYQRTVNDMRLAGLNPLSMQGTNGAGEAIQTEPLNNSYQHSDMSNMAAIGEIMNAVNQFTANQANLSQQTAQTNLINQQAENQRIKNLYEEDLLSKSLEGANLSNIGQRFKNERENIAWLNDQRNYLFNKQFGISDNMPDFAKIINYATHQGNLDKNVYSQFNRNWDNFGSTFNYTTENPQFNNLQSVLENSQLKGALTENKIGQALLSLLGVHF